MSTLFVTAPGRVMVLPDGSDAAERGLPVAVDGVDGGWFPRLRAILVGGGFALDGAVQFTPTLGDLTYGYAFRDRITQLRLDGVAFAGACAGEGDGLTAVLETYHANKASARATPVVVQVGTEAAGRFRGNLVGLRAELGRPEDRIAQFSYLLDVFSAGE